MIVGRQEEFATTSAFVGNADRWPSGLIVEGEPGIGKTTLWEAAIGAARDAGDWVLRSSPSDADADLAYAVLADLLRPLNDIRDALPEPQRLALAVALLETEAIERTDPRAVAAAVLSTLSAAAASAALVLAIDDVQWVDPETDRVLAYAFRRLDDSPVRFLLARRDPAGTGPDPQIVRVVERADARRISLGPLGADAIAAIVHRQHPSLSRLELEQIHTESAGNPFFAMEFARALTRGDDRPTGLSLPIPKGLRNDVVRARFTDLSPTALEALLIASASTRPTVSLIATAMGEPAQSALAEAERASVIRIHVGEISFEHPLYRSAIYADASRSHRHRVHATLAEIVEDAEERGRHLSLSVDVPDERVAGDIERAAASARGRGAPAAAAALLSQAIQLTPTEEIPSLARRLFLAGNDRFAAGDAARGLSDVSRAVDLAAAGPARAEALASLGGMERAASRLTESRIHLEAALEENGTTDDFRCAVHAELFATIERLGDEDEALDHAEEALLLARGIQSQAPRAHAYAAALRARTLRDGWLDENVMGEAPELWGDLDELAIVDQPRTALAFDLIAVGLLDRADELMDDLMTSADARADDAARAEILDHRAWLASLTGDLAAAQLAARESLALEEQLYETLGEQARLAWIEAALGDVEAARTHASNALDHAADRLATKWARSAIGMMELALGRPADALAQLELLGTMQPPIGAGCPGLAWFLPDLVDALVAVGRTHDADVHVSWLEERGTTLDRPFALATGARGRGSILTAQGDLAAAEEALDRAVTEHERLPMPYELGRTLLVQGSIRRRAGRKRLARETLEHARAIFLGLGAVLWAHRVDAELAHITGRRPGPGKLTDAERNVARLAAAGFRNREIAEQLFLSVRTVEGHLSDVYAKLGIRSRTELAASLRRSRRLGARANLSSRSRCARSAIRNRLARLSGGRDRLMSDRSDNGGSPPEVASTPSTGEGRRPLGTVVASAVDGLRTLARQHVELTKIEATEAVAVRGRGAGMFAAAGVVGAYAIGFAAATAAAGLAVVLPVWAAILIVTVLLLIVASVLVLIGRRTLRTAPQPGVQIRETLKEDGRWARQQISR